jgi:L-rhamnose isomerase
LEKGVTAVTEGALFLQIIHIFLLKLTFNPADIYFARVKKYNSIICVQANQRSVANMSNRVEKAYDLAKEAYSAIGVDTQSAIDKLNKITLSLHCWQGDDVGGFENFGTGLTGGIAATGNYPGKARTPDELRGDLEVAMSVIPGSSKVNLHANYAEMNGKPVDRDKLTSAQFSGWAQWAVSKKIGLDFNPTYFSHPKAGEGTLCHPDRAIRQFWVDHGIACRKIGEYFGKTTGVTCLTNIWLPDGAKDMPADTAAPRQRLTESLDAILAEKIDPKYNKDAVESKLFGIGSEAYVAGSHEFYMGYAIKHNILLTLDAGHFHPTEVISAKISALMLYLDELLLHVSRPVRWDSDHVVLFDDELQAIMAQIVRGGYENRVNIALDYFDASINRVAAWAIGARNTRKALLKAFLEPVDTLKSLEAAGDNTSVLALTEEYKSLPWSAVWDYYCQTADVPVGAAWLAEVKDYEAKVLSKR